MSGIYRMDDETAAAALQEAEARGYRKGYRAGRMYRVKGERAAFLNAAYLALLARRTHLALRYMPDEDELDALARAALAAWERRPK